MSGERPFFIVGSGRSGTTLLRLILDRHPRLAVPPESHFIVARRRRSGARSIGEMAEEILRHRNFLRWGLDPDIVRTRVDELRPTTRAETIRAVFSAYAAEAGKPRWGDKTPRYVLYLPWLARQFPDAQFIHMIRDGREVAVSVAERTWGPDSPVSASFWWRRRVGHGLRDGPRLGPDRYTEIRLERLVADPEGELRRLCAYLGESYEPEMLDSPRLAAAREAEPDNLALQRPTAGVRDWRAGLSGETQAQIEAACHPLLVRLGYPVGRRSFAALARAWASRPFAYGAMRARRRGSADRDRARAAWWARQRTL